MNEFIAVSYVGGNGPDAAVSGGGCAGACDGAGKEGVEEVEKGCAGGFEGCSNLGTCASCLNTTFATGFGPFISRGRSMDVLKLTK